MLDVWFFLMVLCSLSVGAGTPSKHPGMLGWWELPLLEGSPHERILAQPSFQ